MKETTAKLRRGRLRRRTAIRRWLGAATVAALVAFLSIPTVVVFGVSVNPTEILSFPPNGFSLAWYGKAITYPQFQRAIRNSLWVTAISTVLAVVIGTAAALALERHRPPGHRLFAGLLLSPLIIPGVVLGLGLLILAAAGGWVGSPWILVFAHTLLTLPFVMRSVWVSLQALDPMLELAAASLGASPLHAFRTVTLPLLRPGILAGVLFALVVSFNDFAASLFISNRVTEILPVAMFNYIRNYTDPTIAAVSTLLILATVVVLLVADRIVGMSRILQIQPDR
jgi:putative spermidine/putrescine transport system permease protein